MRPSDDELKQFNVGLVAAFRANGGEVRGWHPLLLLTTVGAKSGQPHTTPLAYRTDGERLLVFAADQGAPRHPAWYHNLAANPAVTVELGRERLPMRAVIATGEERERLFRQYASPVQAGAPRRDPHPRPGHRGRGRLGLPAAGQPRPRGGPPRRRAGDHAEGGAFPVW